jgi:hypothetical protein
MAAKPSTSPSRDKVRATIWAADRGKSVDWENSEAIASRSPYWQVEWHNILLVSKLSLPDELEKLRKV